MKNKLAKRSLFAGFSIMACLTLSSIQSVRAAPPIWADGVVYVGLINYDCGSESTVCPETNRILSFDQAKEERLFSEVKGEKPIPVRPGYKFVDWKITSIASGIDPYNGQELNVGDMMSDWDKYTMGNIYSGMTADDRDNTWGYSLNLKAVWEPLGTEQGSLVPIKVSIPSTPINVTLPASIDFTFLADSVDAVSASNMFLKNNSKVGNIKISNVKTTAKTGWTLKPKGADSYFKVLPFDSKEIYIGLSKDASTSRTYTDISSKTFTPADWKAAPNGTLPLYFEAKTGAVSSALSSVNAADIIFTLAYEKAV